MNKKGLYLFIGLCISLFSAYGQGYWHGKERVLRYQPEGEDIVIVNGDRKFNRALYGTNTAFRIETSDVPEFGFFMPHMGGNLQLGLLSDEGSLWLNDAQYIKSIYRAGSRIYEIKDPFIGKGELRLTVLAMHNAEGMVAQIETKNIPEGISLVYCYGGADGKRFYRNGDLGVDDPDAFALKAEKCAGNAYSISDNQFVLSYGEKTKDGKRRIRGLFSENTLLKQASPYAVMTPRMAWASVAEKTTPLLLGKTALISGQSLFWVIKKDDSQPLVAQDLARVFDEAEAQRKKIAGAVRIDTPDPYINTLGGVLSVAADGIWEPDCWLHGAIGWRMPLNGWRAAYTGDAIGWHDRARKHFDGYAASQIKHIAPTIPHPAQDEELNLARAAKQWGTPMYSNGYITRNQYDTTKMHHYNMNLVYIDQLLWHLNWTGDLTYARRIWPVITRHLVWEKRNYDPDNDGLYDAYAAIWASDALQYNSGAVTHTTAYNYRANRMAALIASLIGENPKPYQQEAEKIKKALNNRLWLADRGWWAEFQDFMGHKLIHPNAGLWTVYHAIDSEVHTPFQAYQATRYVDTEIPHIPVRARGLEDEGYYTLSTTNWLPYSWSVNNVAFAEVGHTALAFWQTGRADEAFRLFKSAVLDGMYLGASPGNIGQISFYDAARGECYRDFGDPIGVYSRALIQGLFGVTPDLLNGRIAIRPGFPTTWDHASVQTADLSFSFRRSGLEDNYILETNFEQPPKPEFYIRAIRDKIKSIRVNGKPVKYAWEESVGAPMLKIGCAAEKRNEICIEWEGELLQYKATSYVVDEGEQVQLSLPNRVLKIDDPQKVLANVSKRGNQIQGVAHGTCGHRTLFAQVQQNEMRWWQPVHIEIKKQKTPVLAIEESLKMGTEFRMIDMDSLFNDPVTAIFRNEYRSPRSPYTTLQIPVQGIGEWCHPKLTAHIEDSGLRRQAVNNVFQTPIGIPFRTPSAKGSPNILFTSLWDNYPSKADVPLSGRAAHAYLLMAGSTNHMQCHIPNGVVRIFYSDGTNETLQLINPETWAPIEQDFYVDGAAFQRKARPMYRVGLKSGIVSRQLGKELKIDPDEVYGRTIDGGAAVILHMPLNKDKTLKRLQVETIANEVIIGLMGITLLN